MNETVFELIGDPDTASRFVFTCEHATNLLPEWTAADADRPLVEDHWGWDIGAAALSRALVEATGSWAVLSCYSRLVCDPNRHPSEASFVVAEVGGHGLSFNRDVTAVERARRRERYFDPYHGAIDAALRHRLARGVPPILCALHSFTPHYGGTSRTMEVGVLFDVHEEAGRCLSVALDDEGFATAINEPYSGKDGLIYAARRHGRRHEVPYLELEVRQDLIDTRESAAAIGARLARALAASAG
ncbi:MAG: N-formylglutamate amidohydrolase [Myxococcales bacterium]|nr:N-formylglutamate amidohydrolase [Myxococcales bacterium]